MLTHGERSFTFNNPVSEELQHKRSSIAITSMTSALVIQMGALFPGSRGNGSSELSSQS